MRVPNGYAYTLSVLLPKVRGLTQYNNKNVKLPFVRG